MPFPCAEWSLARMLAASALSVGAFPCCCSQYCMTMATLAAPQPSFSCFTNGTSSQAPAASAASSVPQLASRSMTTVAARRSTAALANRNNDENHNSDDDEDDDQVALTQRACGKISLRLLGLGRQVGQLFASQH